MHKKTILLIGRVLLFCLTCGVILVITSSIANSLPVPYSNICSIALALTGAFLLSIVFARWDNIGLKDTGIAPASNTIVRLLTGFGIGSLLATMQPALVLTFAHVTISRVSGGGFITVITSFVLYLLIACREEIAFRGYPMRVLNSSLGAIGAQIIIAIIFIIEHRIGGMTWIESVIGPGMGAIFFGVAVLKTKGLALSTGLHTAWNFVQWFLGFKPEHGVYQITVEKGFENNTQLIGWVSYIFVMGLGICIIQVGWKDKPEI